MDEKPSPSPTADPAKVLRRHFAKLLVGIQSPNTLAAFLYSEDLINYETKGKVTSTSAPFVEKSSMLLNAVESTVLVSSDQKNTMLRLCAVLEESGEPPLRKIAADMRRYIAGKFPTLPLLAIMSLFNLLGPLQELIPKIS